MPNNIQHFNIKVYEEVLNGTLEKFPRNFWKEEQESAPYIVRHLIENILKWNDEDIKNNFSINTLKNHKLAGMLKYVYNGIISDVIEDAYPSRFHPWELNSVPNKFWHDVNNCIDATRWLVLEKLNWSREDIALHFNNKTLTGNNMSGLLKWGWNGETLKAVKLSFPEYEFKDWELLSLRLTNFTQKDAASAIRWFIEEKKQWNDEQIKLNWRSRPLRKEGILKLIKLYFNNSMFEAIDFVYPNRFKQEDFPLPRNYSK